MEGPTGMRTYIVDIDGTLANLSHRLHFIQKEPKKWDAFFDACDGDSPIQDVIDVIRAVGLWNHYGETATESACVVYLTGRPERVRFQTCDWLRKHHLPLGEIVMRKDGDHRPDTIAKKELLDRLISEGHQIAGVFEDRPSVVRTWRELGLTVFQMTHEEF